MSHLAWIKDIQNGKTNSLASGNGKTNSGNISRAPRLSVMNLVFHIWKCMNNFLYGEVKIHISEVRSLGSLLFFHFVLMRSIHSFWFLVVGFPFILFCSILVCSINLHLYIICCQLLFCFCPSFEFKESAQ